jgi:hypothetical protein
MYKYLSVPFFTPLCTIPGALMGGLSCFVNGIYEIGTSAIIFAHRCPYLFFWLPRADTTTIANSRTLSRFGVNSHIINQVFYLVLLFFF